MTPAGINGFYDPLDVTPENIDCFQQNRLRYVARDLHRLAGVPIETTRKVLLARGVAKWMRNRRVIIDIKHRMKMAIGTLPPGPAHQALVRFYGEIQRAAKSSRWTLEAW